MKRFSYLIITLITAFIVSISATTSFAATTQVDPVTGKTWIVDDDGGILADSLVLINGQLYCSDTKGYMIVSTWIEKPKLDNSDIAWYYFDRDGKALQDTRKKINRKWYYFDGWYMHDDIGLLERRGMIMYCTNKYGELAHDTYKTIDGVTYYFNSECLGAITN